VRCYIAPSLKTVEIRVWGAMRSQRKNIEKPEDCGMLKKILDDKILQEGQKPR